MKSTVKIQMLQMCANDLFKMEVICHERYPIKKPTLNVGFKMILCPEQDSNLHIRTDTSP